MEVAEAEVAEVEHHHHLGEPPEDMGDMEEISSLDNPPTYSQETE